MEEVQSTTSTIQPNMLKVAGLCVLQLTGYLAALRAATSISYELATKHSAHLDGRLGVMAVGLLVGLGAGIDQAK